MMMNIHASSRLSLILVVLFLNAALVISVEGLYSYVEYYEKQLGDDYFRRCERKPDPPDDGVGCRATPKACMWGNQECPASSTIAGGPQQQPTIRCNCYEKSWRCQPFLCPTIELQCPSSDPSSVTPAPICSTDLACGYGEQTCCGRTIAKK